MRPDWFDGVKKQSWTGLNFGFDDRQPLAFHRFSVGMGNCADESWDQTQWSAIAFDDVVVSTSYIGPIGTPPDTTPPVAPTGLAVN